jgi:hypothetical protein
VAKKSHALWSSEWQRIKETDMPKVHSQPCIVKPNQAQNDEILTQVIDRQHVKHYFEFNGRYRNPEYQSGIEKRSFRSCLLHNKDTKNLQKNVLDVRRKPKYFTFLKKTTYDVNSGEITDVSDYMTDDLTSGNNRKIKALNRFVDIFKSGYRRRQLTILFKTLTIADKVDTTIKRFIFKYKRRLERNGHVIHGYFWVLEISDKGHIHYHILIVTDRINCKGKSIPKYLKANNLWGARTKVEFVRKGVKYYLAKYFVKNKSRITSKRLYGQAISKNYISGTT